MRKLFGAVLVGLLVGTLPATADTLKLKNGDRLTGTIVKADDKALVLKTEYAGAITISWEAIQDVESTAPLNVFARNGQKLVGPLAPSVDKIAVTTNDAGKVELAKSDITTIRNAEEQAAWQKEQDRSAHPGWLDLWAGSADFGLALTTGNAATTTTTAGVELARTTQQDKTAVFYQQISTTDRSVTPTLKLANAKRAGVDYDYRLKPRVLAFAFTHFDFDERLQLDLRFRGGGGLGFQVMKSERASFRVFGGAAYYKEIFDVTPAPTTAVPNPAYTTLTRNSVQGMLGQKWSYTLNARTSFSEKVVWYPAFTNSGSHLNSDVGMTTAMSKYLSWNLTFSSRYLSQPPLPGIKKNDTLLTTGIRFTFAQ